MDTAYHVDPDITVAAMLPGNFYRVDTTFALARERVFARTWQWLGDTSDVTAPGSVSPRELLPGLLDEPVLLARDAAGTLRCLSNVCTHRANVLVVAPGRAGEIRCGHHGRRFALDGRLMDAPGFEGARDFPAATDDLPRWPLGLLGPQAFAALAPAAPFEAFFGRVQALLAGLPFERCRHDPARDRDYHVAAHWALYVENALDMLEWPAHEARAGAGAPAAEIELQRFACVRQILATGDEPAFAPRDGGPAGPRLAACDCWVFPNLLLKIQPGSMGLSLVLPLAADRTRVACRTYVWDERARRPKDGAPLEQLEMASEALVERMQRGVRSRSVRGGRYAPQHERALHHFHRLLCEFMAETPPAG